LIVPPRFRTCRRSARWLDADALEYDAHFDQLTGEDVRVG
jgi:hypothetical protein